MFRLSEYPHARKLTKPELSCSSAKRVPIKQVKIQEEDSPKRKTIFQHIKR